MLHAYITDKSVMCYVRNCMLARCVTSCISQHAAIAIMRPQTPSPDITRLSCSRLQAPGSQPPRLPGNHVPGSRLRGAQAPRIPYSRLPGFEDLGSLLQARDLVKCPV